jgi:hypothetical protein
MREISKYAAIALREGKTFRRANTTVTDSGYLLLHGSGIARKTESGLCVSLCGWNTVTTRERLNALLDCYGYSNYRIVQRKGFPYFLNMNTRELREMDDYAEYVILENREPILHKAA